MFPVKTRTLGKTSTGDMIFAEDFRVLPCSRLTQRWSQRDWRLLFYAADSRLAVYPLNLESGKEHVIALSASLAGFGTTVRAAIDTVGKAGDADTADLFTEVSRAVDKLLWMVEAHNQSED